MVLVNRCGVAISPHNPAKNPTMSKTTTPLTKNWTFAHASDKDSTFRPVASVPTEIFLDLLAHKLIPDPFQQQNEIDVQWVGEEDWIYRVSFPSPACTKATTRTDIVFEGLDTYATVTLNGREILRAENMFTSYRVDVTGTLHECGENELTIVFESAFLRGKKVQEKWPDFYWGSWNGDASRLAVRKAQYHYVCHRFSE
jgi:beta-mannosidase